MREPLRGAHSAGLWGPVCVSGGVLLLLAAPLMRGGNRFVALIPLEIIGLLLLACLWARWLLVPAAASGDEAVPTRSPATLSLVALIASPLVVALVQLVPLPPGLWERLPGHAAYLDAMRLAGAPAREWRALSLAPAATAASLLAAIPLVAAFVLALQSSRAQLRLLLRVVVALAFAEVLLGLLQISGGEGSPFFFGVMSYGPPVGTFANRNHYANYIAMALVAYVWLAYESAHEARRQLHAPRGAGSFNRAHATAAWIAGGLVLVLGVVMSRSRGAALFGLPAAALAMSVAMLRINGMARGLKFSVPIALLLVVGAAAMVGFDAALSRLTVEQLASSAGFRGALARASLHGAAAFFPLGSGWGTYDLAFQRFLPPDIPVYPNHAHQDYVEMLFEGGLLFVVFGGLFLWLVAERAWLLVQLARHGGKLGDDAMAAAICGIGLAGLLAHSLVEFNLRIPANAILGALLAGVLLKPLPAQRAPGPHTADRPRRRSARHVMQ